MTKKANNEQTELTEENNQSNKKGQLNENRDDIPHGHGAHVNEKESNAQEDYPGPEEANGIPRE